MSRSRPRAKWHDVYTDSGEVREKYIEVLRRLQTQGPAALRSSKDQMAATLREMGVTFRLLRSQPWGREAWTCDLLPHIFERAEWELVATGVRQRLKAWEAFLADVYGNREILRAGVVPVQAVLASPNYQHACIGLPRPRGAFLHLAGVCLVREQRGRLCIKQHNMAHATGISYMLQNRRALARVKPEIFEDIPVQSIAETSLLLLEELREMAPNANDEPVVVLLSPGEESPITSEHSFLARRMGIPMVQGGDLLVLDDCVYLKTVRGLEQVHVIYNCVPDAWLDPLVFRRDSLLGVPGLVHCLRRGTVALVNGAGSNLADDRSLLAFASHITRFYLNETPILPTVPTLWMGDIDQREYALSSLDHWCIRPVSREWGVDSRDHVFKDEEAVRKAVRKNPSAWIAQPWEGEAGTLCIERGKQREHPFDHFVYGIRTGTDFGIIPGALTRVHTRGEWTLDAASEWSSKDTWVVSEDAETLALPQVRRRYADMVPARQVTSRVAESFYWMGRYLERTLQQAYLISVVETLETEELNSAERKHYRPMWSLLLPPIEKSAGSSRRSIANRLDRYRLVLLPEPGSVFRTFMRALNNADAVQDSISPEAAAALNSLRERFQRTPYREGIGENAAAGVTMKMASAVIQFIPQFFGIARDTMLADDGWRFCELGMFLERAIIVGNSVLSISSSLAPKRATPSPHATELELSAFLRLLGTRDAYRRIYQMRAEPKHVLELLWQHPQAPRSVRFCLERCRELLIQSVSSSQGQPAAADQIESLLHRLLRIDWSNYVAAPADEDRPSFDFTKRGARADELKSLLREMLDETMTLHTVISDAFLNHQARIAEVAQPYLSGI